MTFALASAAPRARLARPFASVEAHGDLAAARDAWRELAPAGGAYQSPRLRASLRRGVRQSASPSSSRATRRRGPSLYCRCDCDASARSRSPVSLAAPGRTITWACSGPASAGTPAISPRCCARRAREAGIDLFAFSNLPARWEGLDHPLALLPGAPSPSPAFASALPRVHRDWLDARFSRAAQKKLRKKARKLEALGALAHVRAEGGDEAARLLEAFFAHKAAQARARGERDLFARPEVRDLLRRLLDCGAMEMHALKAGERIVATFGALPGGRRLSGLVVSYDGDREVAAASPGEWLMIEVARDAIARGFEAFDLGVGESRYKRELCEIEETLRDAAFGVTALGRLAAPCYLAGRLAMGEIKRRPRLFLLVQRLRRAL